MLTLTAMVSDLSITARREGLDQSMVQGSIVQAGRFTPLLLRRRIKRQQESANKLSSRRSLLNGKPLPTSFDSKNEIVAIGSSEAIAMAGTYVVTLKCEEEALPESHTDHLVVGFLSNSEFCD